MIVKGNGWDPARTAWRRTGELGLRNVHIGGLRWHQRYVATLVVADLMAVVLGTMAAVALRFNTFDASVSSGAGRISYTTGALLMAPIWVATLSLCGVYEGRRLGHGSEEYRSILNAAVHFLASVAVLALMFRLSLARGLVAITIPLAAVLTMGAHYAARRWLHNRRAQGLCMRRVLVVGSEQQVADLVRHFRRSRHAGLEVVGACVPRMIEKVDVDGEPVPVVGGPNDVMEALADVGADTVALADHETLKNGALRRLGWQLEGSGTDLIVAPSVLDVAGPRIAVYPVAGLPLLHVEEPQMSGFNRLMKEAVDRVGAGLSLVLLSPFLLAVGLVVRATSKGPAVFRQVRVGREGQHFTLYKFRTMRAAAETEREALDAKNEHDGPLFKMRNDPRRTAVGRWLRRLSIDELPQLWNVVTGRMSIVGPRPPLPAEVDRYSDEVRRRLLVKPGLTGLWQVSGRADLPWPEAVRLDLYYVENWSPALDMVIVGKTLAAVVRGRGAY